MARSTEGSKTREDVRGSTEQKAWEAGGKVQSSEFHGSESRSHSVPVHHVALGKPLLSLSFPSVNGDSSANPQNCCEESVL